MANRDESSGGNEAIAPAQVSLNVPQDEQSSGTGGSLWQRHGLAIAGLAVSVVALVAVIFLLPGMISPVQTPPNQSAAAGEEQGEQDNAGASRGPSESPWQDAQFAKARRETQEVLQRMLDKQEALEEIQVQEWGGDDYRQALQMAEQADHHYQQQEFEKAKQLYQRSLSAFNALLKDSEQVFENALTRAEQAITDGDPPLARQQVALAAMIKPGDEQVARLRQRSEVLEEVLASVNAGEQFQRNGELDEAREQFRAALALDSDYQPARQGLKEVDQAIADREFARNMSAGFSAMGREDFSAAISAFKSALTIRPDAADARSALQQAENENTQTTLQGLLSEAQAHESREEWQAAVDKYQQALAVDKNLVAAQVGAIRAGARAEIDADLEKILAAPQRLTTPAVHREYQAFYEDTRRISNRGPRLESQLQQLQQALQKAVEPVTVQLLSDNATHVTIYKVGELGSFEQTELDLRPGTYTVVGTRKGYRDVRQEITVAPDAERSPITIQCEEKISRG